MKRAFVFTILLLVGLVLPFTRVHAQAAPLAVVLKLDGALTPVMTTYLERGLAAAIDQKAEVVVIQLDTPGGGIDIMERLVQDIRSSTIPVVVYVSPNNAMAGSAGTLITLAGRLSAMAPETTIGAASPVGSQGQDIGQTLETKVKEILKASARTLTANRKPEATKLAEDMIDSARAVTVDEALQAGLIDLKAASVEDLLAQLNGHSVQMDKSTLTLHTAGIQISTINTSLIEDLLQLLIDPNLVFMLLSVGVWAILIELSSPGGWVAGFVGVVCLLLGVYGLGILPVNWFGILFMILAFVLFVLEVKTPSHGLMTLAGATSFIIGALVLFNSIHIPGIPRLSIPLVIGTGIFLGSTFMVIMTIALRAQRRPIMTGREALVGQIGLTRSDLSPEGTVHVGGENWRAVVSDDESPLQEGMRVQVIGYEGLRLKVRKVQE